LDDETPKPIAPAAAAGRRGRQLARDLISATPVWEGSVGWSSECLPYAEGVLERFRSAGFAHVSLTIAAEWNSVEQTMRHLARVRRWLAERSGEFVLVATAGDILAARQAGKLAVSFNFQGGGPFGGDPGLVALYAALGVKLAILSYNMRNALGDGCQETGDAGLSALGKRFVEEMNRVGMIIDLSHAGRRTAGETIELSYDPVVFSHSNPRAVHPHVRNIGKALIRACAAKGGVIGINSLSFMLATSGRSTVEDYVRHIAFVADLVGPEHVALGMDWNFYDPFMQQMYKQNPELAALGYPPPPWDSLAPETLPQIVETLLARGWRDGEVAAILGGNMMRLANRIWR
jgi:membrane dipeptidase